MSIDPEYDFRQDVRAGVEPDAESKKLQQAHKLLWSKKLPAGEEFTLEEAGGCLLCYRSNLGELELSSDSIAASYIHVDRMSHIINQLDDPEKEKIWKVFYTIGGFIMFPSNKNEGNTINQSRGLNHSIKDRFDLTLECIRRYYQEEDSPLFETFCRYESFFDLFKDFRGYVDFFLLQDLVEDGCSKIKFFLPFNGSFSTSPFPQDLEKYWDYIKSTEKFVLDRGLRMYKQCHKES